MKDNNEKLNNTIKIFEKVLEKHKDEEGASEAYKKLQEIKHEEEE